MTDHQLKKAVNTYFDVLHENGIPEKHVADFKCKNNEVTVMILTGKTYSKKLKRNYVETTGDVRTGLVSSTGGSLTEPIISRTGLEASRDGESENSDNSKV